MLFYRAAVPLSGKTFTFVVGIIRRHRVSIGHTRAYRTQAPKKLEIP